MATPKQRSNAELAAAVYGADAAAKEIDEQGLRAGAEDPGGRRRRTNAELGKIIYPPQDPRFADVDDAGRVADVIRDTDGNIIIGGDGLAEYGDFRTMLQFNARRLANASLKNIDFGDKDFVNANFEEADLKGSSFHGDLRRSELAGADLRGTLFTDCDLRGADLTDVVVDHETDLAGADLTGATYDYVDITRCKNWQHAKGVQKARRKE